MKYITYALVSCSITVLIVFVLLTIDTKAAREVELEDALPGAVESAMDATAMKGSYTYENRDAYIADFSALLLSQINASTGKDPNLKIRVDIAGADEKRHLLSVHVKAQYTHPNGKTGNCEVERTAILESEHQRNVYSIKYYYFNPDEYNEKDLKSWTNADGSRRIEPLYKTYNVVEGEEIPIPDFPQGICYKAKNVNYSGWKDMKTNTALTGGMKAGGNMVFVASW